MSFTSAAVFRKINLPDRVYHEVNADGTRLVGDAALRHGVGSFVYCSTQGVHGNVASPPGNENSPIRPEDYYQQTKYEGEQEISMLVDHGLPATTLRPMAIYGPGDPAPLSVSLPGGQAGTFPDVRQRRHVVSSSLHRQPDRRIRARRAIAQDAVKST